MQTYIIHGKGTLGYAYIFWLLAALALGVSGWHGGPAEAAWALPIVAAIALIGWALWWNPRLEVNDAGLRVVNVFKIHEIPWSDLARVEQHYGLFLHVTSTKRRVGIWAIPQRSSIRELKAGVNGEVSHDDEKIEWENAAEPSAGSNNYARKTMSLTQAAAAIEERHTALKSNKSLRGKRARTSINTASLIAFAAIALLLLYVVLR